MTVFSIFQLSWDNKQTNELKVTWKRMNQVNYVVVSCFCKFEADGNQKPTKCKTEMWSIVFVMKSVKYRWSQQPGSYYSLQLDH